MAQELGPKQTTLAQSRAKARLEERIEERRTERREANANARHAEIEELREAGQWPVGGEISPEQEAVAQNRAKERLQERLEERRTERREANVAARQAELAAARKTKG